MSGFQKSLDAFGNNASNSSSAGASSRGTPSPREERPAKSVSSSRQGGASSSHARAPSRLEEREREERSHRSTRRPDHSSGDRGQSPPRKRKRITSRSTLLTRSRTRWMVGARCAPRLYQLLCLPVRTRAVQVPAYLETTLLSLDLRVRLRRMRPPGAACWRAP